MTEITENRPPLLTFYSFNGDMLPQEIEKHVRDMKERGINGFFIHARSGLEIEYMGVEWMECCGHCIRIADELNMMVYIYDENGWPSGFCDGLIPAMGDDYRMKRLFFSKGIPSNIEKERFIAAYAESDGGCIRIPLENADEDSIVAYYTADEHYVDLLYPDVTKQFISITHEKYKEHFGEHFGGVIRGIFTDEPQLPVGALPWSAAFSEYYTSKFRGDLLDDLWMFHDDFITQEKSDQFFRMANELFVQGFTKPLFQWCEENNLEFTGHFAGEDGLFSQIEMLGGVMPHYMYQQMPGIDHLGRRLASPVLMRQVTSAAEMLGRDRVISEVFGCAGWDVSFNDMAWIWGWHAAFGINVPCLHLTAYSIKGRRKRDYPAFYSYQEPWWDFFGYITDWMHTVNEFITGKRRTRVMVLSAVDGSRCLTLPAKDERLEMAEVSNQYRYLIQNLLDNQVDFDIGDEAILKDHSRLDKDKFIVGECSYDTIIIPQMPSVSGYIYEQLRQFSLAGGRLFLVNSRPNMINGIPHDHLFAFDHSVVRNRFDIWNKTFKAIEFIRSAEYKNLSTCTYPAGIVMRCTFDGDVQNVMLFNAKTDADHEALHFSVPYAARLEIVNPVTGAISELKSFYNGQGTFSSIDLAKTEVKLIRAISCERDMGMSVKLPGEFVKKAVSGIKTDLLSPNVLVIDRASYSINDSSYYEEKPLVHIHDDIYKYAKDDHAEICLSLRYRFNYSGGSNLSLAFEDDNCFGVLINEVQIKSGRQDWYIDKCIGCYGIDEYVKKGENVIEIKYKTKGQMKEFDINEVFETLKNIFFYPVEPESIYILGDFDVCADGEIVDYIDYYSLQNATFSLTESTPKTYSDITLQNCWFYRGDVKYAFTAEKAKAGKRHLLALRDAKCTLARVMVNNKEVGAVFTSPYELDITDVLDLDENTIEVIACGHNRNIFGPHHHVNGAPRFVGVSTFLGVEGYEDFTSPELAQVSGRWTDNFNVVPFDVGTIEMIEISEDDALYNGNKQ